MKAQYKGQRQVRMLNKFMRRFGRTKLSKPLSKSEFENRRQKLLKSLQALSALNVDNGTTMT